MITKTLRPLFDAMIPEKVQGDSIELQRQYVVVVSLILISIFFLVTLGVVTTLQGATKLSILDFGIATIFVGLGIILRETGKIREISSIVISMLAIYFYYLFFYGGLERTTWVWYYTFPLWSIFLKGKKNGTTLSLLLIGVTIATYIFMSTTMQEQFYSNNMIIRLLFSYLCVVFITYVMEDTRLATYKKLQRANDELNEMVEELNKTRGQLHELSITDSLTGLYNRRHFDEVLQLSLAHSSRYDGSMALLLIDIDRFKNFNSEHGQLHGDTALKEIAKKLSSVIKREADTLCRYSGDQFAVILNNCRQEHVFRVCETLHFALKELNIPLAHNAAPPITISIGGITVSNSGSKLSSNDLMKSLNQNISKSKDLGGNCSTVEPFKNDTVEIP